MLVELVSTKLILVCCFGEAVTPVVTPHQTVAVDSCVLMQIRTVIKQLSPTHTDKKFSTSLVHSAVSMSSNYSSQKT